MSIRDRLTIAAAPTATSPMTAGTATTRGLLGAAPSPGPGRGELAREGRRGERRPQTAVGQQEERDHARRRDHVPRGDGREDRPLAETESLRADERGSEHPDDAHDHPRERDGGASETLERKGDHHADPEERVRRADAPEGLRAG